MLVNGQIADSISIEDRGLLYGDGVFETILCEQGQAVLFDQHVQRLHKGCERLQLTRQDEATLQSEIMDVAQGEDCVIKIVVTRGVRTRGYRYDKNDNTYTRIVYRSPVPEIPDQYYQQGIAMGLSDYRLPDNEVLAGIKHLNRLDQVLACQDWEIEFSEKVILNHQGFVIEGTMSNVFIEAGGMLKTPTLRQCGVEGVMRQWLIDNARQIGVECIQSDFDLDELKNAEAIFMCNSVIGIWPVTSFQNQKYPISEKTKVLMQLLNGKLSKLYIT